MPQSAAQITKMPAVSAAAASTIPDPASLKAAVAPAAGQFDVSGLFVADKATREAAAAQFAALAQKEGPSAVQSVGFTDAVVKALGDKKSPAAREGAAHAVAAIAALALVPGAAEAAAGGGGSMPYSSWLTTFKTSVSGEVAQMISLVVVVGSVAGWILAGQLEGLLQVIMRSGLGIAIVVGAAAFITSVGSAGAVL